MTNSKPRMWVAGTGVLAVLVLVATWFLLVSPKRAEAAALAEQRAVLQSTNDTFANRTATLKAQFETLDGQRAKLALIRETLPAETEVPALLRQLEGYSKSTGVVLLSITPGAPVAEAAPAAPGAAPAAAPGAAPAPAPAAGSTAAVYSLPLTVTTAGSFAETELYLKNLQADMKRFFLVENLALSFDEQADTTATGASAPGISATITGRIYVLRTDTGAKPATAPATPEVADTTTDAETVS
ncbi:type IV pilus assembly protein PilO [Kineococcus xinjiangensis]|uniref:Type IV pilus assembly protein PilO n=1 Tax=Kineococcus xinjiangensis TaxID=512762 RepID=A0A2S6IP28_9ACTN|nr:type 4a pilus biogenesis protein PilO [Kineococcus xinjiangensis]PPK96003.1 type IV pilus assembly protein PilO [Kineococcus xinjiangensis]